MGKPLTLEEALKLKEGDEIYFIEDPAWQNRRLTVTMTRTTPVSIAQVTEHTRSFAKYAGTPIGSKDYKNQLKLFMSRFIDGVEIAADDLTKPLRERKGKTVYAGTDYFPHTNYSKTPGPAESEEAKKW